MSGDGDGDGNGKAIDLKRYAPPSRADMAAWQDEMRAAFFEAVGPDDMRAIVRKLVEQAKGGDLAAVKVLLAYGIGPAQVNVKNAVIVQGGRGERAPPPHDVPRSLPPWVHERVRRNLGLVHHLARRHAIPGVDAEDLVQEGVFGLIRAAEKFDPARRGPDGRPIRFSTYASRWIRHFFQREALRMGPPVRVSRRASRDARAIDAGRLPPGALGPGRRACALAAARAMAPDPDVVLEEIADRDRDARAPRPDDAGDPEALSRALAALGELERGVVVAHFGLDGRPPRTLREIGEASGLPRSGVRRIKDEAIARLAARLEVDRPGPDRAK